MVIAEDDKQKIAWIDIEQRNLQIVTTGPDDSSPFWLSDNTNILFVRENHLHIVNTKSNELQTIDKTIQVDRILGVSQGVENSVLVVYHAYNPDSKEIEEVYMLELNNQLKLQRNIYLVDYPIWFIIPKISPKGDQVVYGEGENVLFITKRQKPDQPEPVVSGSNRYYEPSWSPDGKKIAFVVSISNRP